MKDPGQRLDEIANWIDSQGVGQHYARKTQAIINPDPSATVSATVATGEDPEEGLSD